MNLRVKVLYHYSFPESADSSKIHGHFHCLFEGSLDRGSYMIAPVLLNFLNQVGKSENGRLAEHFITFVQ